MDIDYWEDGRGRCPVEEFIAEQPPKAQEKILGQIELLEELGLQLLGKTDFLSRLKGYDLYELTIKVSRVLYRIFLVIRDNKAWLVHVFKKQSKKTPQKEIKTAIGRKYIIEQTLLRRGK